MKGGFKNFAKVAKQLLNKRLEKASDILVEKYCYRMVVRWSFERFYLVAFFLFLELSCAPPTDSVN